MIELRGDVLVFRFPEVHEHAELSIGFQRTLRVPDDERSYPLPPGLGRFPLRHVDDFAARVPPEWVRHGGVLLPMYQSEAMWLNFTSRHGYPFAVKVATGKVDAATGKEWREGLHRDPQDYMPVPGQPWLDGYCVEKGLIRQFVAMPLGAGYSAEEQVTGKAEHGGLQGAVYPLKREVYERMLEEQRRRQLEFESAEYEAMPRSPAAPAAAAAMGLAPGGRMRQEIFTDRRDFAEWDQAHGSRCFVHIANSLVWRSITGQEPPTSPRTAEEYTRAGLPWFEYYADRQTALGGSAILKGLKSVLQLGKEKGEVPLPENVPVDPANVVHLRDGLARDQVREGAF
jgi:hypothetical protein